MLLEMIVVLWVCLFSLLYFFPKRKSLNGCWNATAVSRILVVVAHPDDECMFFGPALLKWLKSGFYVSLLCLSSGNYYHLGDVRKKELVDSCSELGIPATRVTIIEHRDLPDDPAVEWNKDVLSSLILKHIETNDINVVVTFDEGGVSAHTNHVALYRSLRSLHSAGKLPEGCCVLTLETINILRKYISFFDLPLSWLHSEEIFFALTLKEYIKVKNAMKCHKSQLLWFRHLYLLFSRYMFINTLHLMPREDGIVCCRENVS
ncbi:N-acetylglucosaminyl-phosphatidylinositol de-N-acetylase [Protopterus annectens]|uniref:N-acetylglucosaminyl-phosphatidylinositol de-N-acetylase n=1 Tax=Protopterus annectens TaxID=7888 RepID=UPI001CFA0ECD|nr:N-acetylglucosaminyl-phosphatidylinositol de-N-acetylase [Protopterus annectens]